MFLATLAATLVIVAMIPETTARPMTPEDTIRGLAGAWTCSTHDSAGRTWKSLTKNGAYGPWLRMDDRFPAQNGQKAGTVIKFLGFDPRTKRWIVMSIDDSGGYYVMESASRTFDASHWLDVYPTDGATGYVRVIDADAYTFDAAVPDGHGHTASSHTRCTRQ